MPRIDGRRARRALALGYAVALLASHLWQAARPQLPQRSLPVVEIEDPVEGRSIAIALRDSGVPGDRRAPIVLLHGSPGDSGNFVDMLAHADPTFRWIAVDLPGFGESATALSDYSFAAHARHLELLLDALDAPPAHLVGFSLGGGVALSMIQRDPERVRSLTLLSSVGVQELELLGNYRLNHLLHGAQLVALWLLREATPHFGAIDGQGLAIAYARNFYDSDQRPLRGILERLELPVLIIHGERDPLVPFAAALEHRRIVPHSELLTFPEGHFLPWQHPAELVEAIADFAARAEGEDALTRAQARPERVARSQLDFAALPQAPATGMIWLSLVGLLVLGTFFAEDLTCLSAGILIAQGRLEFSTALAACAGGIFFGDLWLYFAGRFFGERVLRLPLLRPVLHAAALHRAERWFDRRGLLVILSTRFIPGARLPTYVAAGVLRTSFWRFASYFLLAVALWTPLIVFFASRVGGAALQRLAHVRYAGSLILLGFALAMLLLFRIVLPALTHRGRRRLFASFHRIRRWEFWPVWVVYLLLAPRLLWLMLRHGGPRGVTAVNPGIENGGLVGESKSRILAQLDADSGMVPAWTLIAAGGEAVARRRQVEAWMQDHALNFPVVLKPDVGERGRGVRVLRNAAQLAETCESVDEDLIAQAYVDGEEFGVFYMRHPESGEARIFSINAKELPKLVGDGRRSLADLIWDDERASILADVYLEQNLERLDWIPAAGESVQLVELGTHCRGAIFRDARELATPQLLVALERALRGFDGFCFGRFDLRAQDVEALRRGEGLRILELNGLSSEAAHIYDPRVSLREGLSTLGRQWELAFEFAAAQRRRGRQATPWRELLPAIRGRRIRT